MVSEQKKSVRKKILTGTVISDKMQKTVVVEVERTFRHPLFNKTVKFKRKYKVHDEGAQAKVGDIVSFFEGRPVSKTKYMYLERVIDRSSMGSK
jgi:small subunit ribosomal protein S17